MKKLQVLLYVVSIAVAVGIGMEQGVKEKPALEGDISDCTTYVMSHPSCGVVVPVCKNLPFYQETVDITPQGLSHYNATDVQRLAGPPSSYQCYLDGIPCSLYQSFTYCTNCQDVFK